MTRSASPTTKHGLPPGGRLRVAMIGVGDITTLHHPAYPGCELADLVALCDVDPARLRRRSEEWGVERTTTDYGDLLEDPGIDLVEVNLPHHLHEQVVVQALDAGKHVACQKPIATTIAAAEAMVAAAQRSAGRLRILENFVFHPPYVRAKQLLDAGEIGTPLTARFKLGTGLFGSRWVPLRSELWHLMESDNGMGQAIFDDGYHKLSVARHLFGPVESVKGFIDRSFTYADVPAQLIWRHATGVLGSFDVALSPNLYTRSAYYPADERIDVVGTHGLLALYGCTARLTDDPPLVVTRDGRRFLHDDLETDWQASFTEGIRAFPDAIRDGRDCLLTGERATEVLRFAYALIVAAATGEEVRPAEVDDAMVRDRLGLGEEP